MIRRVAVSTTGLTPQWCSTCIAFSYSCDSQKGNKKNTPGTWYNSATAIRGGVAWGSFIWTRIGAKDICLRLVLHWKIRWTTHFASSQPVVLNMKFSTTRLSMCCRDGSVGKRTVVKKRKVDNKINSAPTASTINKTKSCELRFQNKKAAHRATRRQHCCGVHTRYSSSTGYNNKYLSTCCWAQSRLLLYPVARTEPKNSGKDNPAYRQTDRHQYHTYYGASLLLISVNIEGLRG